MSASKLGSQHISGEILLFYNRPLIWILTGFSGFFFAIAGMDYVNKLSKAMPQSGMMDALAIYSFVIAAYLLMLISEVIDNYYFRVFAYLCMIVGGFVTWQWIIHDAQKLTKISMAYTKSNFQLGWILSMVLLVIVVVRLVKDWARLGGGHAQSFKDMRSAMLAGGVVQEKVEFNKQKTVQELAEEVQLAYDKAAKDQPLMPIADQLPENLERKDLFTVQAIPKVLGAKLICDKPTAELSEITFEKESEQIIGRTEGNIKIPTDMQISRKHAMFAMTDQGIKIIDLGSTNGVLVNNKKVSDQILYVGDVIQIGSTIFNCE